MKLLASVATLAAAQYGDYYGFGDYGGQGNYAAQGKGDELTAGSTYPDTNGLFCWMCDNIAENGKTAYFNCLMVDHANKVQACKGEERACMWEERRRGGMVYSVCGGCKTPDACIHAWNHNWRYHLMGAGTSGVQGGFAYYNGDCLIESDGATDDPRFESVCRWCCAAGTGATSSTVCNGFTAGSPIHQMCDGDAGAATACPVTWFAPYERDNGAFMAALEEEIGNVDENVWTGVGRNPWSMEKAGNAPNDAIDADQIEFERPGTGAGQDHRQ